jgi:polysaccharide export outer membrane protein
MMRKKLVCILVFVVGLSGCASLPPLPPPTEPLPLDELAAQRLQLPETVATLGPDDMLKVVVYDHPDLSVEVTIGADGTFAYPLLGTVQAGNLTVQQLEKHMIQRLAKDYLVNPQLTITVLQQRSRHVYVLGAVRQPGVYPLKYNATLLELISQAGGPTPEAGSHVVLVKGDPGDNGGSSPPRSATQDQNVVSIDLEKLLAGTIRQPVQVSSNDTIYVPKPSYVFVTGQVQRPGRYLLERDITARKAIILAGGLTQFAAKSRLQVRRMVNGEPHDFRADMDDPLQAEDVLIVPESVF